MTQRTHRNLAIMDRDMRGLDNRGSQRRRGKHAYFDFAKEAADMISMSAGEILKNAGSRLDSAVSMMRRHADDMESCCKKNQAKEIYGKIGDIYGSCGLFSIAGSYYKRAGSWKNAADSFMKSKDFMLAGKMFSEEGNGRMARKAFLMAAKNAEGNGEICHARRAYHSAGRKRKVSELDMEIRKKEEMARAEIAAKRAERIRKRNLGLCK